MKFTSDFVSIGIGLAFTAAVSGFPMEVYNNTATFSIFSVSMLCLVTGVYWLLWQHGRGTFLWSGTDMVCLCFLFVYMIRVNTWNALWNIGCLSLMVGYMVIRQSRIRYSIVYGSLISALGVINVMGYLQYFGILPSNSPYFPITSAYHNPAVFAIMQSLLLCVVVNGSFLAYRLLKTRKVVFYPVIAITIVSLPLLVLASARAAWMALLVSILFVLYIRFIRFRWNRKLRLYLKAGICCLLLSVVLLLYAVKPRSADGRLLIWKVGLEMVKDKPLTGWGIGGFEANYMYYQAKYLSSAGSSYEKNLAGSTHLAFNEPLRILIEQGCMGSVFYLVFILWVYIRLRKKNGVIALTARSVLVTIGVWGLFAYPNHVFPVLLFLSFGLAFAFPKRRTPLSLIPANVYLSKAILLFALCVCSCLGIQLGGMWKSYHEFYLFLQTHTIRDASQHITIFQKIEKKLWDEKDFLYLYCSVMKKEGYEKEFCDALNRLECTFPSPVLFLMKGDYLQQVGHYEEAAKNYWLANNMVPSRQAARGRLAFLYHKMGKKQEAIELARCILTEEVKEYSFETFELHQQLKETFCLNEKTDSSD